MQVEGAMPAAAAIALFRGPGIGLEVAPEDNPVDAIQV